jgi:hypothetical protein
VTCRFTAGSSTVESFGKDRFIDAEFAREPGPRVSRST